MKINIDTRRFLTDDLVEDNCINHIIITIIFWVSLITLLLLFKFDVSANNTFNFILYLISGIGCVFGGIGVSLATIFIFFQGTNLKNKKNNYLMFISPLLVIILLLFYSIEFEEKGLLLISSIMLLTYAIIFGTIYDIVIIILATLPVFRKTSDYD